MRGPMRRPLLLLVAFAAAVWPLAAVRAQDDVHVTDVVKIQGIIDGTVEKLIDRRLEDAPDGGLVILQIDSPGTIGVDVAALAERIAASHVPVAVWAGPPGSLLQGGAVALLEAAHIAATSPGSGIGPGTPEDLVEPDRPSALGGVAAGYARDRGRRAPSVRAMFEPDAQALTPQESLDRGVVDLAAQSIPNLLNDLAGREVETLAGTQTLVTEGGAERFALRFSELGPIDRVLHAVASPSASYLLLVVGLWALSFELVQPGFGLAGVTGIVFLGLAAYSLSVLSPDWLGLGLILAGVALYVLDVRLRRLGPLTVLGTGAFAAGSLLIYGDVAPAVEVAPWVVWSFVVGSVLYFGFALTTAIKSRERAVAQQQSGLVGLVGEAASDLAPEGQVVVKGATWQGRSLAGPIPGGTRVRVRNVQGLVLEVTADP